MERVAIIGVGISPFQRRKKEPFFEFAFEAAECALNDACITDGDIQQTVLAGYDLSCGRTISNMYTAPAGCGYMKDEIRVAEDGIFALALAVMRIMGGMETCMVLAYGVNSEGEPELISNLTFEPIFTRAFGITNTHVLALQSLLYKKTAKVSEEDAYSVLFKNIKNGRASFLFKSKPPIIERKEFNEGRYAVYPLRTVELPRRLDGAVALIVTPESIARRIKRHYVVVEGLGWNNSSYYFADGDFSFLGSVERAARRAYKMCGVEIPLRDIDFFEVSEATPYHEIMLYEAMGVCEKYQGKSLIRKGYTLPHGKVPFNISGGMLSGDADTATGLGRVAYAYRILMNEGARRVLAHGRSGIGYQNNCVVILKRV